MFGLMSDWNCFGVSTLMVALHKMSMQCSACCFHFFRIDMNLYRLVCHYPFALCDVFFFSTNRTKTTTNENNLSGCGWLESANCWVFLWYALQAVSIVYWL